MLKEAAFLVCLDLGDTVMNKAVSAFSEVNNAFGKWMDIWVSRS